MDPAKRGSMIDWRWVLIAAVVVSASALLAKVLSL